jgi:ComF family protein
MPVREPVCDVCGLPQRLPGICDRCQESKPAFHQLRAWAVFDGPIRQVLHSLKYRRNLSLGDTLAQAMAQDIGKLNWSIDIVVPIPLSDKRRRERGYNQVALVAMPLADILKWMYKPQALKRIRETQSQVGLSLEERRVNVTNAFQADTRLVSDKSVLLMDDVATTGATLSAAASALTVAGAKKVYALTLARALPHHSLNMV